MTTGSYLLLTGSQNNSGDFLIKHRAMELLRWLRPDRELIDVDAWKPLDDATLGAANRSKAVIFAGGPALQQHMVPRVYALRPDLADFRVPLLTMGIGWRALPGTWPETRDYRLSSRTLALLESVEHSGFESSVRDYHTLNVLQHHGFRSFRMTGCPALYARDFIGAGFAATAAPRSASFSVGVSFLVSRAMQKQMENMLSMLAELVGAEGVTAVFHHSTDRRFFDRPGSTLRQRFGRRRFLHGHERLMRWLDGRSLRHIDVSGDAEAMLRHYGGSDLHVGYRVHAHILMTSLSRPSLLLTEDGRARALREVIGGLVLDGYDGACDTTVCRYLKKLRLVEPFDVDGNLHSEVRFAIEQERREDFSRSRKSRAAVDVGFESMRRFIAQLP